MNLSFGTLMHDKSTLDDKLNCLKPALTNLVVVKPTDDKRSEKSKDDKRSESNVGDEY